MLTILASQNKGKLREMAALLNRYGMRVVSRDDAGLPKDDVEENGTSFEENSFIKADAIRKMIIDGDFSDLKDSPVIADDSGLMVDALGGAPGVYSARYAGEQCSYEDNNKKLLSELNGVPFEKRTAHFVTVITVIFPDGTVKVARGECNGKIAEEIRGEGGFGYDPVFIPDGYEKTFSELGTEFKNTISHRAKALAELEKILSAMQL